MNRRRQDTHGATVVRPASWNRSSLPPIAGASHLEDRDEEKMLGTEKRAEGGREKYIGKTLMSGTGGTRRIRVVEVMSKRVGRWRVEVSCRV